MYDINDVLILGDSFCNKRKNDNHWPWIISNSLTGKADTTRGQGFSGASWWSVRKALLKELNESVPKILIICHTEYNRIPNDLDFGLNVASADYDCKNFGKTQYLYASDPSNSNNNLYIKNIPEAALMYYKYLISEDFNLWARNKWFEELDSICVSYKIEKILHIHCFQNYIPNHLQTMYDKNPYVFKAGSTLNESLYEISDEKNSTSEPVYNHFTAENNKKIAESILSYITNYKTGLIQSNLLGK